MTRTTSPAALPSRIRWAALLPLLSILLGTQALPAVAEEPSDGDDCPTWLPDFHCDRQGRFPGFVAPMTMPYLFEDPFITTGANFVALWHDFPSNGLLDLGQATVLALQLRVAITDRLAFIATKDGLVFFRPDTRQSDLGLPNKSQLIHDDEGFTDISAGFKYAAVVMPEQDFILTPAVRIEIPVGNRKVFQGQGDGVFIPSMSWAWGHEKFHVIGDVGGQVAFDTDKNSDSFFYNLHADYAVLDRLVPFMSLNGMHWTRSGDGSMRVHTSLGNLTLKTAQNALGAGRFEGADYANLGSSGVSGKDLLTLGWGVRVPLDRHISLGAVYERAVEGSHNLFTQRVTLAASYEF